MRYHNHEIRVVVEDFGYYDDDEAQNKTYQVYGPDGQYINTAWSLDDAKMFIDSGYDDMYLF